MDAAYMRVKQVACKIGMSSDWVRRFFGETEGVRKIKSPAKRFRRPDTILLIPTAIVERELRKLATGPGLLPQRLRHGNPQIRDSAFRAGLLSRNGEKP